MGPTLDNLHNLLSLPTGNAEMTMANFAPDVYVANYLDITGQFNNEVREKTVDFMEKGMRKQNCTPPQLRPAYGPDSLHSNKYGYAIIQW